MHTSSTILMRASRQAVFETAADLSRWPEILPHYRFIHYYERSPERNVVKMAALRSGIPISWVSEQLINRVRLEVRFRHLKAFTKGMEVLWTFDDTPEGVRVTIVHDLRFRIPALAPLADPVIGGFFVGYVAGQTLECMKRYLEADNAATSRRTS